MAENQPYAKLKVSSTQGCVCSVMRNTRLILHRNIGETDRSLSERVTEHMEAVRRFDFGSFII